MAHLLGVLQALGYSAVSRNDYFLQLREEGIGRRGEGNEREGRREEGEGGGEGRGGEGRVHCISHVTSLAQGHT